MVAHARKFIELVMPDFAPGVYTNIHWKGLTPESKPFWDGRAGESLDEVCRTIQWVNSHNDKDIYLCMSTQSRFEEKTSAKGNVYRKAVRLAENAVQCRSLFADIDVKEDLQKGYASTQEALAAFQVFLSATGLPIPSAVVASGTGGFHVHWAVERAFTAAEWQPLANALAAALSANAVKCDTQCTIDIARILRVPDTFNRKQETPLPVTLLSLSERIPNEVMEAALKPFIGVLPARVTAPAVAGNDELGANLTPAQVDISITSVAKSCDFVARSIGTGGADNDQPLWFMTASIATFAEEGRDALHMMSKNHKGYQFADTEELFDRVQRTQKARDLGWPQCAKIAGFGAKECQSCQYLHQGKSPLNYALSSHVDTADPTLPDRFVRNKDGIISIRHVSEDGALSLIPLCHYPIYSGWLSNDPWTFHFVTRSETGRRTTMELPTEVIFARDGFSKYLGAKGFFCTDTQYKLIKEFFVSWLQKLQQSKDSVISASPFGWSAVDGKIEGFSYAGRVWMRDGDRPAANPNPVLAYQYTPKGSLSAWTELARVIFEQRRPALNAIIAVAFAAPLVRFTGFPGLLLNTYSAESGIGKTTAMKVSQSVWGHPVLAMQGLNDTANSVLGKMGQIRSLPMYWDELKSEAQTRRFVGIVFDLTGGREKTRMNSDTTLRLSGTWQTMMVSASNDSIIDAMAREVGSTTAGLHRLFEYAVPKTPTSHDIGMVQRLTGKLEDNYGNAGFIYAKFLGKNWSRVEAEVADKQDEICREIGVRQEERHWSATIAILLKGAEYANELNLGAIDIPALKQFLFEVLQSMRDEVAASPSDMENNMSVSAILSEFLKSMRARNTLVTNKIWIARGAPVQNAVQILSDVSRLDEIAVQIGKEDKLIRISSIVLSRWMAERGYSRNTFTRKLEREFGMRKVNGKLGGGTNLTCTTEYLIELDGNDKALSKFVDVQS